MSIAPIQHVTLPAIDLPGRTGKSGAADFASVLESAISSVEQYRAAANAAVERTRSGEGGVLQSAVLAAQRAELSLELFVQVRNKVVQAYQEVMRMQM
jgi:flagellar hook-basal body complex protein FliE